jgi:hypothetical protein
MTVQSSEILRPTSSVGFAVMLVIWLETVPKGNEDQIQEMKYQVALVLLRNALVVAMPLTGNTRYAQSQAFASLNLFSPAYSNS